MTLQTTGIHHVALNVADLEEALDFYVERLGFTPVDRPDFGFPGAWLGVGAHQIHLVEVAGVQPDRRQHVALAVADLDAVLGELDAAGVSYRRAPHTPGAGQQAFLIDPTGNRIELNEPEPATLA